jgi:uncharacterized protein DUF1707/2TM domain-containing protein
MNAEGPPEPDATAPRAEATVGHRVSDAEREAVADRLRAAAGEGRLDADELDERLTAAYGARTSAELAPLTADLPAPPAPAPARVPVTRDEHVRRRLAAFITANLICIGIWAASGADGSFWPVWVLLGTGIGLVAALVQAFLGVEGDDHDRDLRLPPPPAPPGLGSPGRPRERRRDRHGWH